MEEPHFEEQRFAEQHKVVQRNTSYYDLKWGSVNDPGKENTWNWIAFFFTTFWLAYRKMYKPFFILLGIEAISTIPSYIIDIPLWVIFGYYVIISFIVGWYGNRWYYNHTLSLIKESHKLSESQQESYLKTKGGTHIGIMIGLNALSFLLFFLLDMALIHLPTETNVKDVVRLSNEAITLEIFTDDYDWNYVKKEGRYHVVEFTGYDYTEEEDVRVIFHVFLDKQMYEWKDVYIDGKKLSQEEAEDYEFWIEDNS